MSPQENNDNNLNSQPSNIPFNNNSNPQINPVTGRPVSSAISPSLPNPLPAQNTEKPTISRDSELILKNNPVTPSINTSPQLTNPLPSNDNQANLDQTSSIPPIVNSKISTENNTSTSSSYSPIFAESVINTPTSNTSLPTERSNNITTIENQPNINSDFVLKDNQESSAESKASSNSTSISSSTHTNNYGAMHTIPNISQPSISTPILNSEQQPDLQSSTSSEFINTTTPSSLPDPLPIPVSNPLPSTNTPSLSDSISNQLPTPTLNKPATSSTILNPQIDLHNSLPSINNGNTPPSQILPSTATTSLPNNKSHKYNKLLKISLIAAVVFFIFAMLISLSLIPFGNEAFASKILDAIGAHKLALGVDSLSYGASYKGLAGLAELNSENPEKCGNAWDKLSQTQIDLKNFSSKQTYTVNPINTQYTDAIDLKAYLYTAFDLENGKAAMDISIDGSSNTNKIKSLLSSLPQDYQNLGVISFSALLKGVISTDNASFALDTLKLASTLKGDLNLDGSLPDWYQEKFNLTAKQKQNIILILSDLRDFANVKLSNLVSAETGKSILILTCKVFDKVDIQAPTLQEFGYGSYKVKEFVRPIAINIKPDYMTTLSTEGKTVLQNIFKDETLKNYLKSKYDISSDINKQVSELLNTNSTFMSKADFDKSIDDGFANALKSLDSNTPTSSNKEDGLETTTATTLFLSMEDGSIFGTKTSQTVKYSQAKLSDLNDTALEDLLKDGIAVNTDSYSQILNSDSFSIKEPATTKNFDNFGSDFNKTTMGKKIVDIVDQFSKAFEPVISTQPNTFSTTRNTKRTSDVNTIENAIQQYLADGGKITDFGVIPLCTSGRAPIGNGFGNINLESALVYDYLVEIPKDPDYGSNNDSGYTICKTSTNQITIGAPHAEEGKIVSITR